MKEKIVQEFYEKEPMLKNRANNNRDSVPAVEYTSSYVGKIAALFDRAADRFKELVYIPTDDTDEIFVRISL